MKKIILLYFLAYGAVYSQEKETKLDSLKGLSKISKNEIGFDGLGLVSMNNIQLTYERFLKNSQSLALAIGTQKHSLGSSSKSHKVIAINYNFYFSEKQKMKGFYAGPMLTLKRLNSPNYAFSSESNNEQLWAMGAGVVIGYKLRKKHLVLSPQIIFERDLVNKRYLHYYTEYYLGEFIYIASCKIAYTF